MIQYSVLFLVCSMAVWRVREIMKLTPDRKVESTIINLLIGAFWIAMLWGAGAFSEVGK